MNEPALQRLRESQNADGGWGPYAGGQSRTESTALALLALLAEDAERARRAGAWLAERQLPDGSWSAGDALPAASWMGSLAVLALAATPDGAEAARRGGVWLLETEGRGHAWWTRTLMRLFGRASSVELDPGLTGWPWTDGSFSWVEPTSYSLLALRAMRDELPADRTAARIRSGEAMLLDRMCEGGGWNYGNSRVLGQELWPYPDTTAVALLALHGARSRPGISLSLGALEGMTEEVESGLSLALAILCFRRYGRPTGELAERLRGRVEETGLLGETRALALATLALDPRPNLLAGDADA